MFGILFMHLLVYQRLIAYCYNPRLPPSLPLQPPVPSSFTARYLIALTTSNLWPSVKQLSTIFELSTFL